MSEIKRHILLVDDDPGLLRLLSIRLEAEGFAVLAAESGEEALPALRNHAVDLVITDLRMGGMDGMELFEQIRHYFPGLPVIILSAQGTIPEAVSAAQRGVFEFLTKPVDKVRLLNTVRSALQHSGGTVQRDESWRAHIISRSEAMEQLLTQVRQISGIDVNVLITGASGTGKELLAKAIHWAGENRSGEFVPINCGALPEQLLESELFGHVKGAFTGAIKDHPGLFVAAENGTLFLDEVAEMPVSLQVKLLRALQERQIRPVGSTRHIPVNARIIAATNRSLEQAMVDGDFREDLFYRLNVVNLHLPDLAERVEDIPPLAHHFLQKADVGLGRVNSFSPAAMELLITAPWPGNVRQLENVVQKTVALSTSQVISADQVQRALDVEKTYLPTLSQAKQQFEHDYLLKLLRIANGSVTEASRLAQRNRTDFYKLLKRHKIQPGQFK
ncbi:MAG: sigma 54-interacting transcriptional regulator [Porticoccaceae bacterium]|nr:sigma 54-interacting transcriptional regulator [Pseudomonadales bacterium]